MYTTELWEKNCVKPNTCQHMSAWREGRVKGRGGREGEVPQNSPKKMGNVHRALDKAQDPLNLAN